MRSVLLMSNYSMNPYLEHLADALGHDRPVRIGVPSAQSLLSPTGDGLPEVLHLHWEGHWIGRNVWWRSLIGFGQLVLVLAVARLRRRRIIWTVHNLVSHDSVHPGVERSMQMMLARLVHRLTVHTANARSLVAGHLRVPEARVEVVPHGAYPGGSRVRARRRTTDARFLIFGLMRPYKRVVEVIDAVVASGAGRLVVAGVVPDPSYEAAIRQAASSHASIDLRLWRQTDDELEGLLDQSDLVVLGSTDQLASGSALLAGSRGVPVLAQSAGFVDEVFGSSYLAGDPTNPATIRWAATVVMGTTFDGIAQRARTAATATSFADMARSLRRVYDTN